ncbi:hypothetical protein SELMODRAFT_93449 [Selaginella moellendorffii]|uniref:Peroxidase n=1 Tax=Selaginella moellendorffii TaxID=88036 RepID=D8RH15_SELML|nr:hypothetical protein SELMODRAFT_93449 [Selaginella moellendorffii]
MAARLSLVACCLLGLIAATIAQIGLQCPPAEASIRDTVFQNFLKDPTSPAGLLRLHFHDCFVEGCDASVMLESTPTDGTDVERFADGNDNSVRGFEIIDEAKTRIEAVCPGAVSCADIIAVAARDSSVILGGLFYQVPTGRYDGRVSNRTLANERLASPFENIDQLKRKFANVGLSTQDLVLLSGGHTIGRTKCRFFENRLYNFTGGLPDPRLNAEYAAALRRICTPQGADPSPTVALDRNSEFSFDNAYFRNLVANNGVLNSDHVLVESSETSGLVRFLAQDPNLFKVLFAESMINMGNAAWKTRANGEIRRKCSAVNTRLTTEVGHIAAV